VLRPKLVTIRDARDKHINKLIQLTTSTSAIFTLPLIGKCSIVMRVYVCLSLCVCMFVCPQSYIRNYKSDFHQFFVHVAYGCGSVRLWQLRDTLTLCTSSFMDNVISQGCSMLPPSWSAVHMQPWAWLHSNAHCAVTQVAGQRMHGTTIRVLKVTSQVTTGGGVCSLRLPHIYMCTFRHTGKGSADAGD